jgi:hypothetical protein
MKSMHIGICLASALGTMLVMASDAEATTFRVFHATTCYTSQNSTELVNPPTSTGSPGGGGEVYNNNTSSWDYLTCPVVTDSSFDPPSSATIQVDGWNRTLSPPNDDGMSVKACVSYANGNGGACSAYTTPAASASIVHMSPSASAWTSSGDAKFLYVFVPKRLSGDSSNIWSYRVYY